MQMSRAVQQSVAQKKIHADMSPEALELVAARFRILAEPVRLRILQALERNGETSIGELAAALDLSQPNVSKHVKILVEAGLVSRRQEGNSAFCAICDESVFELCDLVCSSLRHRLGAQAAAFERRARR